jgi:hypothetical protein
VSNGKRHHHRLESDHNHHMTNKSRTARRGHEGGGLGEVEEACGPNSTGTRYHKHISLHIDRRPPFHSRTSGGQP